MIFTERTVTVRNGDASIDAPVILYRGDRKVEIRFKIVDAKFKFQTGNNIISSTNASFAQLAILNPNGSNAFTETIATDNGTVLFVITGEMIDQLEDVGSYTFHIRLFDKDLESRITLPEVTNGFEVREPISIEDDGTVGAAIVGYSIVNEDDASNVEVSDTFDSNGDYNKTIWRTGDGITEGKLNKIEDALDKINQNEIADVAALDERITSNFNTLSTEIDTKVEETELQSIKETVNEISSELYIDEMRIDSTQWVDAGGSAVYGNDSVSMGSSSGLIGTYNWVTVSNDEIYGLKFTAANNDCWFVLETNSDNTLAIAVSAVYAQSGPKIGGHVRLFTNEGRGELTGTTFINKDAQPVINSRCIVKRISDHKYQIETMKSEEGGYTPWIEVNLNVNDGKLITCSGDMISEVTINLQDFHTSLGSILYSGYANQPLMTDITGLIPGSLSVRDAVTNILEDLNIYPGSGGGVPANVVDLVIFMGQSNMAGRGVAAESPVVPEGHGYEFRAISDPTKLYPIVEPFGVNENNSSSGVTESSKTGSMVSSFVSNYYKVTKVPIVAVSCSKGGTQISWWQPDGGPLNDAIARHELAKNWLETNGYIIRHDFMVWCQGCSDGDNGTTADDYTQGIKNMIEAMMTCGVEKCFLVRIGNHRDNSTLYDVIIQAQTELCKTYENAVLVSCKLAEMAELGLMKDQFHYKQEGYNIVGKDAGINTAFYINNLKEPTMWDPENDNLYFSHK